MYCRQDHDRAVPQIASGEKAKARDLIAAIRTVQAIERENRFATADEQAILAKFPGFGPVALRLFPDPVTGQYKDASWQALGEELESLLTADEYASAKRTTFNAFYTSPWSSGPFMTLCLGSAYLWMRTLSSQVADRAISWRWLPSRCTSPASNWIPISGRIAKARHPHHDIRIEDFRDTKLPGDLDAVVGNVPFADVRYDYHGQKLALHDYFLAKSLDALAPGGILAVVTTHYTLDKQKRGRSRVAHGTADFLGPFDCPPTPSTPKAHRW